MANFTNILKHLLPTGRAWRITAEKTLRNFFIGLGSFFDYQKLFFDLVFYDFWPSTTRALDEWEDQFGLDSGSLTDDERRTRLNSRWSALGGQDPRYLQDTLQDEGFDVYVHDWWDNTSLIQELQGGVDDDLISAIDVLEDGSSTESPVLWNDDTIWDDSQIWMDYTGGLSSAVYVDNNCLIFSDGTGELSIPSLTGSETVSSYVGTAVPTIGVGKITFSDGTLYEISLSDGSQFVACEGNGDVVHNRSTPNLWDDGETWNDSDTWEDY